MKKDNIHIIDWERVSKYLSGEMNEKEVMDFENLIDTNPQYADVVSSSEKDLKVISDLHDVEETFNADDGWAKVMKRIMPEVASNADFKVRKLSVGQIFIRIAAIVVFVLGVGYGSYQAYINYLSPYEAVKIAHNESSNVVILKDGSTIHLHGDAQIKYSRKFNQKERRVKLSGEAYFDIARNPEKPFIIKVNGAEVKVLGTAFNVNAKTDRIEVFVERGKVQLSVLDDPYNKLILRRGDFGTLHQNEVRKEALTDENYLAWKTKQMIFREMKLMEVADVINRTYLVSIQFQDPDIRNMRLTSTFDHEPLEIILESLSQTFNLAYEQKGNEIVFRKSR